MSASRGRGSTAAASTAAMEAALAKDVLVFDLPSSQLVPSVFLQVQNAVQSQLNEDEVKRVRSVLAKHIRTLTLHYSAHCSPISTPGKSVTRASVVGNAVLPIDTAPEGEMDAYAFLWFCVNAQLVEEIHPKTEGGESQKSPRKAAAIKSPPGANQGIVRRLTKMQLQSIFDSMLHRAASMSLIEITPGEPLRLSQPGVFTALLLDVAVQCYGETIKASSAQPARAGDALQRLLGSLSTSVPTVEGRAPLLTELRHVSASAFFVPKRIIFYRWFTEHGDPNRKHAIMTSDGFTNALAVCPFKPPIPISTIAEVYRRCSALTLQGTAATHPLVDQGLLYGEFELALLSVAAFQYPSPFLTTTERLSSFFTEAVLGLLATRYPAVDDDKTT